MAESVTKQAGGLHLCKLCGMTTLSDDMEWVEKHFAVHHRRAIPKRIDGCLRLEPGPNLKHRGRDG